MTTQPPYPDTFDNQMQTQSVLMGNLSAHQVSTITALTMLKVREQHHNQAKGAERTVKDMLLETLMLHIEKLNQKIEKMEAGFHAQYGDAWREEIAQRVLDPDDIPLQADDESITDYRARLECQLIDEMLDDDGKIKDEYKNDPELRKYGEWAQTVYQRNAAQDIANDLKHHGVQSAQGQELLQDVEERANSELNNQLADQLDGHKEEQNAVLKQDDNLRQDTAINERGITAKNNFLNLMN